jgi:hypothetical protein
MRPINVIASDIRREWKKVYFGAVPYLDAMGELNTVEDNFYCDSGRSIVLYFLANANTFRGPAAKALKAELKAHAGVK